MHFEDPSQQNGLQTGHDGPWYRGLTSYHWFVLAVAALGWLFDTMDQQLFNLARVPAITELLNVKPGDLMVGKYAGWATSVFIIGWAIGGLIFGIVGDKIGRARTMLLTILLYSIFTGLSALATGPWDFMLYRFLTGLGVGGEFAVGVALVAEVMPDHARARALGWLQALSAVGNMTAAMIAIVLGRVEETGSIGSAWRWMFVIGTLPALLAIIIRMRLREPDRWKAAAAKVETEGDDAIGSNPKRLGSLTDLFTDPTLRRNTIVGMLLALSGVIGLWGIGFFSFDLMRQVFRAHFEAQHLSPDEVNGKLTFWTGIASLVQNAGAFFGVYAFSVITQKIGRRPTFALFFLLAMGSTAFTFWFLNRFSDVFWMLPLMGFCQIALFGGYAIYFPELFPTRLRSTGTSFCYNVGRLAAAAGPSLLSILTSEVYGKYKSVSTAMPLRYAGVTMCACFLIGLAVLPFAPETKGKPLPE